jgi:hypothetical protein
VIIKIMGIKKGDNLLLGGLTLEGGGRARDKEGLGSRRKVRVRWKLE